MTDDQAHRKALADAIGEAALASAMASPKVLRVMRRGRSPRVRLMCRRGRQGPWHDSGWSFSVAGWKPLDLQAHSPAENGDDTMWSFPGKDGSPLLWTCQECFRTHKTHADYLGDLALMAFLAPKRVGNQYVAYVT